MAAKNLIISVLANQKVFHNIKLEKKCNISVMLRFIAVEVKVQFFCC